MTPAALVSALEGAGVRFRIVAGRLDLEAASEPPRSLLEELHRQKAAVLAFLREREAPPPVRVVDRRAGEPGAAFSPTTAALDVNGFALTEGTDSLGFPRYPDAKRPSDPAKDHYGSNTRPISESEQYLASGQVVVASRPPGIAPSAASLQGIRATLRLLREGR